MLSSSHDNRFNLSGLAGRKTWTREWLPLFGTSSPDLNKSQVFLSSIDKLHDERNPFDIEFCPSKLEEGRAFDGLLKTELQYRGLPTIGTIGDKQQPLRAALVAETIYDLMKRLVASTDWNSAFCEVETVISCIMHGGNYVGEKLFMLLLIELWN